MNPRVARVDAQDQRHQDPHVKYAGERITYGILFIWSLFYEYSKLEDVHIHVIYGLTYVDELQRMARVDAKDQSHQDLTSNPK